MRLNSKVILGISAVSGLIAFAGTFHMLKGAQKSSAPYLIVAAARDIEGGEVLAEKDLRLMRAPAGIDEKMVYREIATVIGKTTQNSLRQNRAIKKLDLEGDNLALLIPEGYRAASVPVSLPKETVDFLKYGTRVDVLYTDASSRHLATKTIMKNIMVMGVSREGPKKGSLAERMRAYVTLAVRPEGMETLAYASRKGTLDLSICPPGEQNVRDEFMTLGELLGVKKSPIPNIGSEKEIEIIRGTKRQMVRL